MRLPETLVVGAHTYRVVQDARLYQETTHSGECDTFHHEIRIASPMPETETLKVFIHEIIHAIEDERDVTLTEDQVVGLAGGLAAVVIHNDWKVAP